MRIDDLAGRIDAAGDALANASTTLSLIDPGPRAFGADAAGHLGELGRALHRQFVTGLAARGREAAAHAARLADTAHALRLVAEGYRGAEDDTRRAPGLGGGGRVT
jgi:hypothetical protein